MGPTSVGGRSAKRPRRQTTNSVTAALLGCNCAKVRFRCWRSERVGTVWGMAIEIVYETHSTSDDNERGVATGWAQELRRADMALAIHPPLEAQGRTAPAVGTARP